jgi:hypothetical protein
VAWFESPDGTNWQKKHVIHRGADAPSECFLQFKPDGTAVMLVRRDAGTQKPILMTARPPYERWEKTELDVQLSAPALWLNEEEVWITGRWFPSAGHAHVGVFRVEKGKPVLEVVLPSGPGFDCSYVGIARHPHNPRRYFLSYYSNHDAPADPAISQWDHPGIYLADVMFDAPCIQEWRVSRLFEDQRLGSAADPDPAAAAFGWEDVRAGAQPGEENFVNVFGRIQGRAGVIYLTTSFDVGPTDRGSVHLGYDGPVRVWLNGKRIFEGPGNNPAIPDKTSLPVEFRHGVNRLAVALDTNGGKAWGIYGRFEAVR